MCGFGRRDESQAIGHLTLRVRLLLDMANRINDRGTWVGPAIASGQHKAQRPAFRLGVVVSKRCLAMTYSRMRMHTTIGAGAFHFRVRDGIGWYHSAMVAKETVECRWLRLEQRRLAGGLGT